MLHLLQLRYIASEDDVTPHIAGHVAYLERYHAAGTFLVSGRTVPTSDGGAIITHGVDRDTIEQITAQYPFVMNGVAKYTVTTITRAGSTPPSPTSSRRTSEHPPGHHGEPLNLR